MMCPSDLELLVSLSGTEPLNPTLAKKLKTQEPASPQGWGTLALSPEL
jgi:hypothetical protein